MVFLRSYLSDVKIFIYFKDGKCYTDLECSNENKGISFFNWSNVEYFRFNDMYGRPIFDGDIVKNPDATEPEENGFIVTYRDNYVVMINFNFPDDERYNFPFYHLKDKYFENKAHYIGNIHESNISLNFDFIETDEKMKEQIDNRIYRSKNKLNITLPCEAWAYVGRFTSIRALSFVLTPYRVIVTDYDAESDYCELTTLDGKEFPSVNITNIGFIIKKKS